MADEDDFDDRKRLRAAENLGWLAGTSSYTKKRKLIEGKCTPSSFFIGWSRS